MKNLEYRMGLLSGQVMGVQKSVDAINTQLLESRKQMRRQTTALSAMASVLKGLPCERHQDNIEEVFRLVHSTRLKSAQDNWWRQAATHLWKLRIVWIPAITFVATLLGLTLWR